MSFWHKISHFLKFNSETLSSYIRDGKVYTGKKCNTCGKVRDEYHDTIVELLLGIHNI